jgi:nucleotide-binding universal stress UspA family protein
MSGTRFAIAGPERDMIDATKIFCPVDFSAHSARALRHAIAVAADRRIPLHVMTIAEDPFRYLDVGPSLAAAGGLGEKLARFIQEQLPPAGQWTIDLETSIAFGVAFQEIVRAALDRGADLIVMGTHGRTSVGRWLFGSTTERVLRTPPCPVLAIGAAGREVAALEPERASFAIRRVMVATDFGQDAAHAIKVAGALAAAFAADLVVVHVLSELRLGIPSEAPVSLVHERALVTASQRRLDEAIADLKSRGQHASSLLLRGTPHTELLAAADQRLVDLIVMGASGRGGVHHSVTGLTTYRVVSRARCPVLVLPTPKQVETAFEISRACMAVG